MLSENSIVAYKLTPKDRPVHPEKLWLGKVVRCYDEQYVLVEIVEPGYDILDLREIITISQIMKVERA